MGEWVRSLLFSGALSKVLGELTNIKAIGWIQDQLWRPSIVPDLLDSFDHRGVEGLTGGSLLVELVDAEDISISASSEMIFRRSRSFSPSAKLETWKRDFGFCMGILSQTGMPTCILCLSGPLRSAGASGCVFVGWLRVQDLQKSVSRGFDMSPGLECVLVS